jgi:glycosyltransferase 2 family protein
MPTSPSQRTQPLAVTAAEPPSEPRGAKEHPNRHLRRAAAWLLRLAIGLAALTYILYVIDVREVWQRIQTVNAFGLVAAVALTVLQNVVFAIRWRCLAFCTKGVLPIRSAIIGNFELAFFVQIVPTALAGDAVRVVRAQRAGLTLGQSVTSVFLDRVIGLATVVFLTPLLFVISPHDALDKRLQLAIVLLACAFAAGLIALYFLSPVLAAVFRDRRLVRLFISISEAFRTLVSDLPVAGLAVLASITGYGLAAGTLACIAAAMAIPVGLILALPVVCMMTLATFIPISIGGWGVREGAALLGLSLFSVSAHDALALSILYGLVGTAVGVIGGIVWMSNGYRQPRRPPPSS